MRRFIVPIAVAFIVSTNAAYADTTVQLAGQTADQIRASITAAAEKVCTDAMERHMLDDSSSEDECVADTVDAAMQKIKDGSTLDVAAAEGH